MLADHALRGNAEMAVKQRRRKVLPPRRGRAHQLGVVQREIFLGEGSVGQDFIAGRVLGEMRGRKFVEMPGERVKVFRRDGQPGGHRVPAEFFHQSRLARRDRFQQVADVQPVDRARRAAQFSVFARRERHRRPLKPLAHARRDQPDHALVPAALKQAETVAAFAAALQFRDGFHRLALHRLFYAAPFAVHRVQRARVFMRAGRVFGQQAFNAGGNVIQPAGRVDARRDQKTERARIGLRAVAPGDFQQRANAGAAAPGANARNPLRDQDAVVGVQRHQVGDRADRDQVQVFGEVRRIAPGARKPIFGAQARAQRQQQIEHHAGAGKRLGRKFAAGLVRIDDRVGFR